MNRLLKVTDPYAAAKSLGEAPTPRGVQRGTPGKERSSTVRGIGEHTAARLVRLLAHTAYWAHAVVVERRAPFCCGPG